MGEEMEVGCARPTGGPVEPGVFLPKVLGFQTAGLGHNAPDD